MKNKNAILIAACIMLLIFGISGCDGTDTNNLNKMEAQSNTESVISDQQDKDAKEMTSSEMQKENQKLLEEIKKKPVVEDK